MRTPEQSRKEYAQAMYDLVDRALVDVYGLTREEHVHDKAISQLGILIRAFGGLENALGKRLLDLGCGSIESESREFEPWLCRVAKIVGVEPVGIDIGSLEGEDFEHYQIDLAQPGALDFLPAHSFDAVHTFNYLISPEMNARRYGAEESREIKEKLERDMDRLVKPGGSKMIG
jgi:hypothetical protein